jgi:hypothetical protein
MDGLITGMFKVKKDVMFDSINEGEEFFAHTKHAMDFFNENTAIGAKHGLYEVGKSL